MNITDAIVLVAMMKANIRVATQWISRFLLMASKFLHRIFIIIFAANILTNTDSAFTTASITSTQEQKRAGGNMWDSIFGTKKATENILDKDNGILTQFGGFINDLHLSEAEKEKMAITQKQLGIKLLAALEPFKVVQRIIAFATLFLWLFVGLNIVLGLWVESFYADIDISGPLIEFAMSQYILIPVSLVLGLYTAGGTYESKARLISKQLNKPGP